MRARRVHLRAAGRRTTWVPYRFFGWTCNAIAGGFLVFMVWQLISPDIVPRNDSWRLLVAVVFAWVAGDYFLGVARRIRTAPEVLPRTEGSVLYLRAFGDEQRPFVSGPASIMRRYTSQFGAQFNLRRDPTVRLTLDDFLGEAVEAQLGPFVALGNPVDAVPPEGAVREYAPDAGWQERFIQLATDASCIVIAFGASPNLEWELGELRSRGMSGKLCLFTAPLTPRKNGFGELRASIAEARSLRTTLADQWTAAGDVLRRAGFDCDSVSPGFGAAVMFDGDGKSVVLTTEAKTPADYVTPVADWMKRQTKSGRHVQGRCASCETPVFLPDGAAAGDDVRCFACRSESELAAMPKIEGVFERHPVLGTIWAIASLVIAGLVAAAFSITSSWVIVPLWAVILLMPWAVSAVLVKRS